MLPTDIEVGWFDLVSGQLQVTPRADTQRRSVNRVVGVVVVRHDVLDRLLVADHVSREPPLLPQNVR